MRYANKIHTVICDDVREEKSNKLSLIGVYSGEVIFKKIPTLLPKFCILVRFEQIKEQFTQLELTLNLPETKPQVSKKQIPSNLKIGSNFDFVLFISPLQVKHIGEAKFKVRIDDSKRANYVHKFILKHEKSS